MNGVKTFSKANLTAVAATVVDFATLVVLVEALGMYYVAATAIAAICGAITNFSLNRIWTFTDWKGGAISTVRSQAVRYALVSATSAGLNTLGVFFFAEYLGFQYLGAKIFTAVLVGWLWNYPMHRLFVWPAAERATDI